MKLIFAIVHDEDGRKVMDELNRNGFSVTKLCSSGGFLRAGNTTLLVGVEKGKVPEVIDIIRRKSKCRKHMVGSSSALSGIGCMFAPRPSNGFVNDSTLMSEGMDDSMVEYPAEVVVGGATIFVVDVERFEKI